MPRPLRYELWFLCPSYEYRYADFQRFPRAILSLYQAFYTGDVCAFVQATSSVQRPWVVTAYWGRSRLRRLVVD